MSRTEYELIAGIKITATISAGSGWHKAVIETFEYHNFNFFTSRSAAQCWISCVVDELRRDAKAQSEGWSSSLRLCVQCGRSLAEENPGMVCESTRPNVLSRCEAKGLAEELQIREWKHNSNAPAEDYTSALPEPY